MPRKRKSQSNSPDPDRYRQLSIFDILNSDTYEVLSRDAVADYNPVARTADYMRQIVESERAWTTTIQTAREHLLEKDPRELYLDFFTDLKRQIEQDSSKSARLARLLEQVAIRGFGMTKEQVRIEKPARGSSRWRVNLDVASIQQHLQSHIVGEHFLNPITSDDVWGNRDFLIGSSDVSQHRSSVPIPARFFTRSVPFLLNNAAGAVLRVQQGQASYDPPRFNPQPNEELLKWMLIDPSYQDELEPEDYQRCLASAMDVGQYKFDYQYLLNADRSRPDIILRDGSLFPQDAYLDNFLIENRRGEFTREAIRGLLECLDCAKNSGIIYCGVSKNVRLKVYSAVLDWYIAKEIDPKWEAGNYTLNDGQMMTLLLSDPSFVGDYLKQTIATCLIRRSFTTRATLNEKANLTDLESSYFERYEKQHDINISSYKQLCKIFHMYMFFIGHSKNPNQQLPRYEFFHHDSLGSVSSIAQKILTALRYSSIDIDQDHSFMAEEPITYIIPTVTQQAHIYSKDVGKYITDGTGQLLMSRYKALLSEMV
ncbi:hypothetical protein QUB70_21035 [Microcoleus sp. A003_D6]|uniref:hypothetical protein n=1 Tax=Microcoleus sp. A003_D6 TaxID=3055266 RepID=UPI002FD4E48A